MITEVAKIEIYPEMAVEFEEAVAKAARFFRSAPGCRSFRLNRSVDTAGLYQLLVGWENVDAHMVDFRASAGFDGWRTLASAFFRTQPHVDHVELAVEGF